MSTSQSLLAYDDCIEFMQQALDDDKGVRIGFATQGEANNYRLRLNAARNAVRRNNAQIYPDPGHQYHLKSHYDGLVFRIKRIQGKFWVYLESRPYDIKDVQVLSELGEEPPPEDLPEVTVKLPAISRRKL